MPFLGRSDNDTLPNSRASRRLGIETTTTWAREEYVPSRAAQRLMHKAPLADAGRQICANTECAGRWQMPWRNRRRPLFEDRWGCSESCLRSIVHRALRRERGDLSLAPSEEAVPHRHRVPLGLVMLGQGWITQAQLRAALLAQREAGSGRIGDWLVRECGLSVAHVTRGLAIQWSCPVLPIDGFSPAAMALTIPKRLIDELAMLPLRVAGSRILYVAFKDRLDASAAFALEQMSGIEVISGLLDDAQFDAAQGRFLESSFVPLREHTVADTDTMAAKITDLLQESQPIGSRLVRVHQHYWLRTWLERGSYSGVGSLPSTNEDVADTLFTIGA